MIFLSFIFDYRYIIFYGLASAAPPFVGVLAHLGSLQEEDTSCRGAEDRVSTPYLVAHRDTCSFLPSQTFYSYFRLPFSSHLPLACHARLLVLYRASWLFQKQVGWVYKVSYFWMWGNPKEEAWPLEASWREAGRGKS